MCKSPAAVGTYCTPEQTTVMRGPQRPMGSSANIYQRDVVLQLEVGMLLFQHFQDLRSECRIISQEVFKVRPVKKHGLTFLLLHHACVLTFGICLFLNNGVCLGRGREREQGRRDKVLKEMKGRALQRTDFVSKDSYLINASFEMLIADPASTVSISAPRIPMFA